MHAPVPADNALLPVIDYDKYARVFKQEDISYDEKLEAVKLIQIMVLEALERYYPDETFRRYGMEKTS